MYSTRVNERVLQFGTSGFLYRSNKLMYDRGTGTLWHQFLGEPVVGTLADSGIVLERFPVTVTTWGEWLAAHRNTSVLDIHTGIYPPEAYAPEDDPLSTYFLYRESSKAMFPLAQRSNLLPEKATVLGVSVNGHTRAYPLELLSEQPVINDSLGGENLVVVTVAQARAARVYQRASLVFSLAQPGEGAQGGVVLADEQARRWRMEEESLVQVEDPSQRLRRLPSGMAYWFGWYTFYPASEVYGTPKTSP